MYGFAGHIGANTLMDLKRDALKAKERNDKELAKRAEHKEALLEATEIFGAALAFGVANGKVGGGGLRVPFLNSPADLTFGVVAHLAAFLGKGVSESKAGHLRALANGALGSYASTLGAQIGNTWKLRGGGVMGLIGSATAEDATTGGGALADEELARMVRPA